MLIKQISIFVENKAGRLAKIVETLGNNNIDISALSIADATDFGVLRLIVDKPELAVDVLKQTGVTVKITDVIAAALDHQPGGLSKVLDVLANADISVEYIYAFEGKKSGKALMVVKTEDMEKSVELFKENGIEITDISDIY